MHDARDAYDNQLLDEGRYKELVAGYFDTVRARARARAKNVHDAEEIASRVFLHLLEELGAGKRYNAPFRVVVHKRIVWMSADYYRQKPKDAELGDWDAVAADEIASWEQHHDLEQLFATLPERERQVCTLRYLLGWMHEQIAEKLEMTRNAVDQALWRAHKKLREQLRRCWEVASK